MANSFLSFSLYSVVLWVFFFFFWFSCFIFISSFIPVFLPHIHTNTSITTIAKILILLLSCTQYILLELLELKLFIPRNGERTSTEQNTPRWHVRLMGRQWSSTHSLLKRLQNMFLCFFYSQYLRSHLRHCMDEMILFRYIGTSSLGLLVELTRVDFLSLL